MITPYQIIYVTGAIVEGQTEMPDKPAEQISLVQQRQLASKTLEAIKAVVLPVIGEGADMEQVRVWHKGQGRYLSMFVDEIGQLKGLPINRKATDLYHANVLTFEKPTPPVSSLPTVAGNAVLFLEPVWW